MDDEEALNKHGDQMTGFGISRLSYSLYAENMRDGAYPFLDTVEKTLLTHVPIEVLYGPPTARLRGDRSIEEHLEDTITAITEEFFPRDNYVQRDGRPVVQFWDMPWVTWGGTDDSQAFIDFIEDRWDNYGGFVEYLREELTIDSEPFLIGDFRGLGRAYNRDEGVVEAQLDMAREFDALTNWVGPVEAGTTIEQDEHLAYFEENFEGYAKLANDFDIDFIPMTIPGFDDRANDCWGADRHVPRNLAYFEEVMELADRTRTLDRITIATYNDFGEGTQIEPGTFNGSEYGVAYLEIIKEFVEGIDE